MSTAKEVEQHVAMQLERLAQINQYHTNFKKDSVQRKSRSYFQERLKRANQVDENFSKTHERLIFMGISADDDYIINKISQKFEDSYLEFFCALKEKEEELFPTTAGIDGANITTTVPSDNNTTIHVKQSSAIQFSRIPAPTFSGKFIDWSSFHDAFDQLINKNDELSNVQRFHYLKQALPADRDVDVHNMQMTDENFLTAWNLIKKRYDNPRILFAHHMNAIYELPTLTKEKADDIKTMLNAATVCINEFKRLDIPIQSCDHWITHYLATKLPSETHKSWEKHLGSDTSIPTFTKFENFLTNRLFIIDAIEHRDISQNIIAKPANDVHKPNKSTSFNVRSKGTHSYHLKPREQHIRCVLCQQDHILRRCPSFLSKDCFERKDLAIKYKLCLNCLSNSHLLTQCPSTKNCVQCGQRHHTLLHFAKTPTNNNAPFDSNKPHQANFRPTAQIWQSPTVTPASHQITNAHASLTPTHKPFASRTPVLLATALIKLSNPDTNASGQFCALVDQGSEGTILSEYVVQTLQLKRNKRFADICGVGGSTSNKSKCVVDCVISSLTRPNFNTLIENAFVLPHLNILLPSQRITPKLCQHLHDLDLADPNFFIPKRIDLILGADFYANIILPQVKVGDVNTPVAQNTQLGWILSGKTTPAETFTTKIQCHTNLIELESLVKMLYEGEDTPNEISSAQDQWCEEYFKATHVREPNGKYMVRLPLKSKFDPSQKIGKSKHIALNRFFHLERRLQRDTQLSQQYTEAINDYFKLKQIRLVKPSEEMESSSIVSCVLPHHAVVKEDSLTTKVRIVFDASAKTSNGNSLNDVLCVGKTLLNDLSSVLLNWRTHKFVFVADIQKMYRCINMHPEDAQYQRILWRDSDGKICEYCLTTVTFGTASAPFTAIRVLHQLADDEQHKYPLAADILRKDIYVDDVLSGSDTLEKALQMRDELIEALRSAGMELRKWSGNTPDLLRDIAAEHQSVRSELSLNNKTTIKTLGLTWNPETDNLQFTLKFEIPQTFTKRTTLSMIARFFDPLGLISPIVISAKLILKEIWTTTTLGWDDELPSNIANKVRRFIEEIKSMDQLNIPRWIFMSNPTSVEIHAFCDGSSTSYASAVYLRLQTHTTIVARLILAKSRVIPNKSITIPRIELCGAVLSTTLVKWVRQNLRVINEQTPVYFWTDASIVLHWINGETNKWQTYVSNRVNSILSQSSAQQWGHVGTADNPADCATRGLTATQLANFQLWWNGPDWLSKENSHWPTFQLNHLVVNSDEMEEKTERRRCFFVIPQDSIIFKYSCLRRLIRVHAWMRRFYNHCKSHAAINSENFLTVPELDSSLFDVIRLVQMESFTMEINSLNRKTVLPNNSKLRNLTPFIDSHRILRVQGRLANSNLNYAQKHPIILPYNHHFTHLLIDEEHIQTMHGGAQLTLAKIRQKFWIINGRKAVRNRIRSCIRCFKQNPASTTQLMGDLPTNRVVPPTRPFISTGVDYTGALTLKASRYRGQTNYKGYIAIFICLATKAIHLEAVTGLTTQHFLWAMQRFIGRRGLCTDMYSDCGTNFMGANAILQTSKLFSHTQVATELATKGIKWHFNPPYSPNFGGLWEANVKSTKHHLKRVVGESEVTYEELSTILVNIEACLNSRPLCPLTVDIDDLLVLTPAHFLISDSLMAMPEVPTHAKGLTQQFHEMQRKLNQFWKRWSSDWLSHLQARPKWARVEPNLQVNELVIVKEDNLPPTQWSLGRVIETHPGKDDLVRVVTVRTQKGVYKRSVSKLCRLPIIQHHDSNYTSH